MSDLPTRLRFKRVRLSLDKAKELRRKRGARDDASGRVALREARLERELRLAKERIATLSRLAYLDELCDVPNRRAFNDELVRTRERIARHGGQGALLLLDVDAFKAVNDTHGHATGDAVLSAIAQKIATSLRASDFAARIGGDEFAVILHQIEAADAEAKAAQICSRIAELQIETPTGCLAVTCTAGVSLINATTGNDVVAQADKAMFNRKRYGQSGHLSNEAKSIFSDF